MSLITRCPACGTMFKVVPDQLRISEGWVRCGHCGDVFDASAHMQEEGVAVEPAGPAPLGPPVAAPSTTPATAAAEPEGPEPLEPAESPEPAPASEDFEAHESLHALLQRKEPAHAHAHAASPWEETSSSSAEGEVSEFSSSIHTEIGDSVVPDVLDPEEIEAEARALREDPLDRPFELRRADVPDIDEVGPHGHSHPMPLVAHPEAEPETENDAEPELDDLTFVRQARRDAFWRGRGVRALMVVALVLLAGLLAVQVGLHDRDRLAATHPALRPWLASLCEATGCVLRAPRQIESIAIDSSTFNKLRGDTYRLNVTLKNQAPMQVAMPALELTLTDAQDQPVLRRVLQAPEIAPNAPAIAPNAEWSTSLALAVSGNGSSRIAGYRVLAFYP